MAEYVDNTFRRKSCPLCNYSDVYYYGELKYMPPVMYSSHEINLNRNPELWKCNKCYSWYTNNIILEGVAASLYKMGVSGDRWSQTPIDNGKSKEILELLSVIFTEGKKVLDIGCNTGEVLDLAKTRGCITTGVEFSTSCHHQLRSKGHQYFSDLKEDDGEYDVIIAFDIVEHIYDLPLFFNVCNKKLFKDGVVIILTGDINSLSAGLCGSKWWYVNFPEHIVFPSKKYFHNIAGFKVGNWIKTYAAVNFRHPVPVVIKGFLNGVYRGTYTGLPSIGPDHVLILLIKNN